MKRGGDDVDWPALCPVCKDNRTRFMQIVKLGREIEKDPETGAVAVVSDDWETVTRRGRPDVELRCLICDHAAAADEFYRAARRDGNRLPRIERRPG